jgi:pseudaminic acid synthase
MKIGNIEIGKNFRPKIIAEISGNHNGSLKKAIKLIELAKKAGADFVKLQTYTADTITLNSSNKDFQIKDKNSLWNGNTLHKLYEKAHTPWEWHKKLFSVAKKNKINIFSTPFDESAVDFLEKLNVPAYKISSFENNHYPLLIKVLKTKKPLIVSTGITSEKELDEIIKIIKSFKKKNFVILKCTSSYPTKSKDVNLLNILQMQKKYNCLVGLSDHTKGIAAAVASIPLGSVLIEKHFNISYKKKGVDSEFSLLESEFSSLVKNCKFAWESLGKKSFLINKNERKSIQFKRSIYSSKKIQKGQKFDKDNIKIIRPGYGLDPKYYFKLLGKISKRNIDFAKPISFKDFK